MAADSVLFIGWDRAARGKEKEALEAFASAVGYWTKQAAAGTIESFEPVILIQHGGDLNGFMLVRGSAANLAEIQESDEFRDLIVMADMSVAGIGIVAGKTGEGAMREVARFQKQIR